MYPDFISRILRAPGLLEKLTPSEPLDWQLSQSVREADDATLAGTLPIEDPRAFALVRGAVLYAIDELDAAHRIFQDDPSALGSYWHGIMHRREGDFDNARYWFRRAGRLPLFNKIHDAARESSKDMARQPTWDPWLFTGQCEQVKFGDNERAAECRALQRAEFNVLLSHCWQLATKREAE